jgi:tetratricopeptide (TPR) repeat protein
MVTKPVVFISSTSDLRIARDLVGKVLYSMGYESVWQDVEEVSGGELLAVLRKWIDPCMTMIQLVGTRYGAEPPTPTAEFGRVSYTQFEARYAEEKLGREVIYIFIDPAFPREEADPETDDRQQLQSDYIQQIKDSNKLRQSNIASPNDVELCVRRLDNNLDRLRKLADARYRRILRLVVGSAAAIVILSVLVVAGFWRLRSGQTSQTAATTQIAGTTGQIAVSATQTAATVNEVLNQIKSLNRPLNDAERKILDEIKKRGDVYQRISVASIEKDFDEVRRLLKTLDQDALVEESYRYYIAKGDAAYYAGELYDAVRAYGIAGRLRPDAVNPLGLGASLALSSKEHPEVLATLLTILPAQARENRNVGWAKSVTDTGDAAANLLTGDSTANLGMAIQAYELSLEFYSRADFPNERAKVFEKLSDVLSKLASLPQQDRAGLTERAIGYAKGAREIYAGQSNPDKKNLIVEKLAALRGPLTLIVDSRA